MGDGTKSCGSIFFEGFRAFMFYGMFMLEKYKYNITIFYVFVYCTQVGAVAWLQLAVRYTYMERVCVC